MFYIRARSKKGAVLWAQGLRLGAVCTPVGWTERAQEATPYSKYTAKSIVRDCIAAYDALELVPVAERPQ